MGRTVHFAVRLPSGRGMTCGHGLCTGLLCQTTLSALHSNLGWGRNRLTCILVPVREHKHSGMWISSVKVFLLFHVHNRMFLPHVDATFSINSVSYSSVFAWWFEFYYGIQ
jgi:hypothetical protein